MGAVPDLAAAAAVKIRVRNGSELPTCWLAKLLNSGDAQHCLPLRRRVRRFESYRGHWCSNAAAFMSCGFLFSAIECVCERVSL